MVRRDRRAPTGTISVAIIGDTDSPEFHAVTSYLHSNHCCSVVAEWLEISKVLESQAGSRSQTDVFVLLQSCSEQFTRSEIDRFIGMTSRSTVVCCYGEWCESDNRTHDFWPPFSRISVRQTIPFLDTQFGRVQQGRRPIPATSSSEEVFADRSANYVNHDNSAFRAGINAIVVSSDYSFRLSVVRMLKLMEISASGVSCDNIDTPELRIAAKGGPVLILQDLDDLPKWVELSLNRLHGYWPAARIFGLTGRIDCMGVGNPPSGRLLGVIPKLDIPNSLEWCVRST